jgi:hypothetical protein
VKIRDGKVANRPIYVALAVTVEGTRDILGLWAGDGGEGAKFWFQVLTELRNRGVADVCMLVCDGLKGLPEAIGEVCSGPTLSWRGLVSATPQVTLSPLTRTHLAELVAACFPSGSPRADAGYWFARHGRDTAYQVVDDVPTDELDAVLVLTAAVDRGSGRDAYRWRGKPDEPLRASCS